jgi:hypothetical protein
VISALTIACKDNQLLIYWIGMYEYSALAVITINLMNVTTIKRETKREFERDTEAEAEVDF